MELRQLGYFVAVAEERNFTRAAQRIPIAQPAISQQIRRLESELGEELFVRDRRGIRLTAAGDALLPHARAMLAEAEHARAAVTALRGLHTGRLAVGFVLPLPVGEQGHGVRQREVQSQHERVRCDPHLLGNGCPDSSDECGGANLAR
jgi:DNA-binding transcriptional LysR family regulator